MASDHAEVGDLLNEIDAALKSGDATRAFTLLDLAWARLAIHIRAEHLCLFPAILNAPRGLFTGGNAPRFEDAQSAVNALRGDCNPPRK